MPDEATDDLNARIGRRVHALRAHRRLSLQGLAARSGVSRSMISLVERGEASPTAVVLDRLATGLEVALAALFDAPELAPGPVSRRAGQVEWRDAASGYLRRNVSPDGELSGAATASPIRIVDVELPAGAVVAYESWPRSARVHHQVWVLRGAVEVTVGGDRHRLGRGDCLAFVLDRPVAYRNATGAAARYAVVQVAEP